MSGAFGSDFGGMGDLDLTENSVSEGLPVLKGGVYDAVSTGVEMKDNKMLKIVLSDEGGRGQITQNFNIVNASADAQRIGRDQLKTFLTHGGHPDPDHPFKHPKEKMLGLKVRIWVEHDGTYTKNNKTYDSWAVKRIGKTDPEHPAPGPSPAMPAPAASGRSSSGSTASASSQRPLGMDDEIPF